MVDFGLASINNDNLLEDIVGTPYYIAPEILYKKKYGSAVDIWSLGILTYFLIDGDVPFQGDSSDEIFRRIMNDKL